MSEVFETKRLKTTVNAESARIGGFGYFGNDLETIKKAVTTSKTSLKTVYARLDYILDEGKERRFGCYAGNFSLFYYTEREHNPNRY